MAEDFCETSVIRLSRFVRTAPASWTVDYFRRKHGADAKTPRLLEIAQKTGGRYFRAKDSEALSRIFRQIDVLEKTPIQVTRYTRYDEATRPLILLGLGALALELLIGSTLVVRVP